MYISQGRGRTRVSMPLWLWLLWAPLELSFTLCWLLVKWLVIGIIRAYALMFQAASWIIRTVIPQIISWYSKRRALRDAAHGPQVMHAPERQNPPGQKAERAQEQLAREIGL